MMRSSNTDAVVTSVRGGWAWEMDEEPTLEATLSVVTQERSQRVKRVPDDVVRFESVIWSQFIFVSLKTHVGDGRSGLFASN
jgi:hypothetical protein